MPFKFSIEVMQFHCKNVLCYKILYQDFKIDWILGNDPYECFMATVISTRNVRRSHTIVWDSLATEAIWWNLDNTGIQKLPNLCNCSIPQGLRYPKIC
jgi:hypothetical protein